jgi:hypothetical protein
MLPAEPWPGLSVRAEARLDGTKIFKMQTQGVNVDVL